jgi:hypothetical protein
VSIEIYLKRSASVTIVIGAVEEQQPTYLTVNKTVFERSTIGGGRRSSRAIGGRHVAVRGEVRGRLEIFGGHCSDERVCLSAC